MKTAIIWCRTSTDKQEWETQRKDLLKVAAKDGFTESNGNIIIIGEQGASAIKLNELYQQEVNQLLNTINTVPEVSKIYVWEISRLARNKAAFQSMEEAIIKKRVQLVCNVPSLKLFDEDGDGNVTEVNQGSELTFDLLVTLAKQEMEIKKRRFSRGKQRLAEQGKFNGGTIPFGYTVTEDKKIVVDDGEGGEAHIVRRIFDMYENGKSYLTIAKELSALGFQGRAVRPVNGITVSLVNQVLSNELLTGEPHKSKGASFTRTYPPIVSVEQFRRCREIAKKNNKMLSKARRIHYAHGILKCPLCGSSFTTAGDKGYYRCSDAYNYNKFINGGGDDARCQNKTCISQNIMDSLLWGVACELEAQFRLKHTKEAQKEFERQIADIQEKLQAIPLMKQRNSEKSERNHTAYVNGQSEKQYQKHLQELREELRNINKQEVLLNEQLAHVIKLKNELESESTSLYYREKNRRIQRRDVSQITDDNERKAIIHKHIRRATVETTRFTYTFHIHPDGKEVFAKRIVLDTYYAGEEIFIFIPYDGKGGTLLRRAPEWLLQEQNSNPNSTSIPEYSPVRFKYLQRVQPDRWKYGRRERERNARKEEQQRQWKAMEDSGYISMDDMMRASGKSYGSLYYIIHTGKITGKKVCNKWFAVKSEFESYLKTHTPIVKQ